MIIRSGSYAYETACPICASRELEFTSIGVIGGDDLAHLVANTAQCAICGWKGKGGHCYLEQVKGPT